MMSAYAWRHAKIVLLNNPSNHLTMQALSAPFGRMTSFWTSFKYSWYFCVINLRDPVFLREKSLLFWDQNHPRYWQRLCWTVSCPENEKYFLIQIANYSSSQNMLKERNLGKQYETGSEDQNQTTELIIKNRRPNILTTRPQTYWLNYWHMLEIHISRHLARGKFKSQPT